MRNFVISSLVCGLGISSVFAAGYASGLKDLGGGSYSFVLNETASVSIVKDGAATENLGALAAGTYNFSAPAGFDIEVTSSGAAGYTQISDDSLNFSFWKPRGLAVNKNAGSEYFGQIVMSNAMGGTTGAGRNTPAGLYRYDAALTDLGADTTGLDFTSAGTNDPYKLRYGVDDQLYVAARSAGMIYEVDPTLSIGSTLIDAANSPPLVAGLYVTGSQAGGDRVVYAADSAYPTTGVLKYDLGSDAAASGPGSVFIPDTEFNIYAFDLVGDSTGDFYVSSWRYTSGQEPSLRKFDASGSLVWSSKLADLSDDTRGGQFSVDIWEEGGIVAVGTGSGDANNGVVRFYDMNTGILVDEFDTGLTGIMSFSFDAAGNLYAGDSTDELLRVFSLGGNYTSTLSSDGTFSIVPEPASLMLIALAALALRRR